MFSAVTNKLSVSFAGQPALSDVSLSLPSRGLAVIGGPSGSGKTTFLRALNRLNDELGAKTSGEVSLDFGRGLEEIYGPHSRRASEIRIMAGMVFQHPNVLPASIWKNMALPLAQLKGAPKSELAGRIEKALQRVGLWSEVENRLGHQAGTLSGGQQQRLCLARALALEPKILLMDEPTSSLDILAAAKVESCLKQLAEDYPVIMVTHSLAQAWRMSDRLYCFHRGRFISLLSRHEIENEQKLLEYLLTLDRRPLNARHLN